ncbi:thioredoxin family protein [Rubripirellula amarantea]|uniref:Thioredoxin n=1 Tax=Rubripirellula amarantea TaxID=2527999 RepID=A0A5C5WX86_9BACT|nr:thioredoxin family protein [Rubripirellula amarantea]MDA8745653.1 thioredoxin family protein [Rubripirellula amarantea]TWT55180.1 Thioredoxin [Rubripirellula amarantea]
MTIQRDRTSRVEFLSWCLMGSLALCLATGCSFSSRLGSGSSSVTAEDISELTGGISEDRLVLAKFGAPWCGPCRQVDAELDKLEKSDGQQVHVIKIDVDDAPELSAKFGVQSIPHMFLISGDQVVDQTVGYLSHSKLQSWIKSTGPVRVGRTQTNPYAASDSDE